MKLKTRAADHYRQSDSVCYGGGGVRSRACAETGWHWFWKQTSRQRQIEVLLKGLGVPQKWMKPLAQGYADYTAAPSGKLFGIIIILTTIIGGKLA
jgi:hypothetical protein